MKINTVRQAPAIEVGSQPRHYVPRSMLAGSVWIKGGDLLLHSLGEARLVWGHGRMGGAAARAAAERALRAEAADAEAVGGLSASAFLLAAPPTASTTITTSGTSPVASTQMRQTGTTPATTVSGTANRA
jgi:hypothetical protein